MSELVKAIEKINSKEINDDNAKPITFKELKIGDEFMDRISKGAGIFSETSMWIEYVKISPSRARATKQVGYQNERAVGGVFEFSPNSRVYLK